MEQLTQKSFTDFVEKMYKHVPEEPRERHIFVSSDQKKYIEAVFSGDERVRKEMEKKFEAEANIRLFSEYIYFLKNEPEIGAFFQQVDKSLKRCGAGMGTNTYGANYNYSWYVGDEKRESTEGWGSFPLMLGLRKGKFSLYIDWEDETGYLAGRETIQENMTCSDVADKLNKMDKNKKILIAGASFGLGELAASIIDEEKKLADMAEQIAKEQALHNADLDTGLSKKERDAVVVPVRTESKVQRNDPCPCGSGKKYKNCCK